jgi:hypothetical protein
MLTEEQKSYIQKQKQAKTEKDEVPGFDLRSRITDKNGEVLMKQDYFIHLKGGHSYYERPVGSGNLYFLSGEPAGRIEISEGGAKVINEKAEHEAWIPPADADAELFEQLKSTQAESAALRKELDAIKKEKLLREREAQIRGQAHGLRQEAKAAKEEQ